VYTFDSRLIRPGDVFVALKGEKADGHDFIPKALANGAVRVVDGLEALQREARDYRRTLRAKVVGVTGSAGKTTTKELLRAFLAKAGKTYATEGNFNNHIGLPLTILNCPADADFLVVEMGTNHPGEIAALCDIAEPDIGVLTNVGTAHLEFFGTRAGIAVEKGTLLRRAAKAYSSREEEFLPGTVDTRLPWMAEALAGVLPGAHNVANACLAYAVAADFGVTRAQALEALGNFSLPGARWRKTVRRGVTFVDDTYNANPDSMVAALDAFAALPCAGRRVAVLGDMFELGDGAPALHRRVFEHAMGLGIETVIGVGALSSRGPCHRAFRDLESLEPVFGGLFGEGDLVLLKASHSMRLGTLLDRTEP